MLVYPNSLSVPIMPNFGIPAAPVGMLRIKVRQIWLKCYQISV